MLIMEISKVAIYYFTGTGNTLLIVKKMVDTFQSLKVETSIHNMVSTDPGAVAVDRTIGIAFPVACFSTYPLVWDFLEGMPDGSGTDILMIDTLSSFSGVLTGQIRNLMVKKNYHPIGVKEVVMPSNINFKPWDDLKNEKIISAGLQKAKYFTHDLVYGISKWKPVYILPAIADILDLRKRAWALLAKKIELSIDNIKCIRCGICYKVCPVENIEMEEYPEFLDKCQFCLRCISFCPTQAISFKNKETFYPYKAQEADEILK